MTLHTKTFSQLSTRELFEILKFRCAVFVVEQNCPYQDIDDIDLSAHHVFYEAQTYAIGFYEKTGFTVCGEEFLEDGIPHVPMTLDLT